MSMELFYTRDAANEGAKLPLSLHGKPSDYWLEIIGTDSDEWRDKNNLALKKVARIANLEERERAKAAEQIQLEIDATLIKDWNFPEACTLDNKITLLKNAPSIRDTIKTIASDNDRLFMLKSIDSFAGQTQNLTSSEPTPAKLPEDKAC